MDTAKVDEGGRRYTVLLVPDDGMYAVEVPALPGCFTQGRTRQEALDRAREAIRVHVRGLERDGEPVPLETERPELVAIDV
jgi:antitoxin HicB